MGKYILRRILIAIPLLFGITVINFLLVNLAPGDPMSAMIETEAGGMSQEDVERMRARYGLDQPLPVRYGYWLKEAVQGNLGWRMSPTDRRPVTEVLMERIPMTLKLMVGAIILANVIGIALGVVSAVRQYSAVDYVLTLLAFGGISVPGFFIALLLIYVFAATLGWFPTSGSRTPGEASILNQLHHMVLPAIALGSDYTASMMRQTRASMLEVLNQDYVNTARAKGLREYVVILRHALRNAALPLVSLFALYLPGLVGGAVIIETVFGWPGMGRLTIQSVSGRDYNMLMGIILVTSIMVLIANLFADIVYAFVDPRIRYT
jgi:peptide/nickel transport system permease protein